MGFMNHAEPYSDDYLKDILSSVKTIAMVGFTIFECLSHITCGATSPSFGEDTVTCVESSPIQHE